MWRMYEIETCTMSCGINHSAMLLQTSGEPFKWQQTSKTLGRNFKKLTQTLSVRRIYLHVSLKWV